jgi:transcription elongation factor Elf1
MKKHMFKCPACNTIMSIETDLEDSKIHMVPPCPCGKSRMDSMQSDAYRYGHRIGLWD